MFINKTKSSTSKSLKREQRAFNLARGQQTPLKQIQNCYVNVHFSKKRAPTLLPDSPRGLK